MVKVDHAAVNWDAQRQRWLVRLQAGEQVIGRPAPKRVQADDAAPRAVAVQAARDEGCEPDWLRVTVTR